MDPRESTCELHVTGCTLSGHSVLARITDFIPYFYIQCPSEIITEFQVQKLLASLNAILDSNVSIHSIKIVCDKKSVSFSGTLKLLQIFVLNPKNIPAVEAGINDYFGFENTESNVAVFNSQIPFELQFMNEVGMTGSSWLKIPENCYKSSKSPVSDCSIEIIVNSMTDLSTNDNHLQYKVIAPFRTLSFDIECLVRPSGAFPDSKIDIIIQISSVVTEAQLVIFQNVFVLGTCSRNNIDGANVLSFKTESELLEAWVKFVKTVDPDFITGYNIEKFDIPYVMGRLSLLGLNQNWGRYKSVANSQQYVKFKTPQFNRSTALQIVIHGRVTIDLYPLLRRNYPYLKSHKVNAVALEFLKDEKSFTPRNSRKSTNASSVLLKTSQLTSRLLQSLSILQQYLKASYVLRVPVSALLRREYEQHIVAFGLVLQECRASNVVIQRCTNESFICPFKNSLSSIERLPNLECDFFHVEFPDIHAYALQQDGTLQAKLFEKIIKILAVENDFINSVAVAALWEFIRERGDVLGRVPNLSELHVSCYKVEKSLLERARSAFITQLPKETWISVNGKQMGLQIGIPKTSSIDLKAKRHLVEVAMESASIDFPTLMILEDVFRSKQNLIQKN